ncbi:hypothetical protein CXF89_04655 [Pseudoalteromonas sp. MelDa3]|nr:hypothetical protein CXF89_04655 [Pseudoalteromonas sp. MelDa3]
MQLVQQSDCLTKVKLPFFVKFKTPKINTSRLQIHAQTITVHKNSNLMVFTNHGAKQFCRRNHGCCC